jgi:PAS domain S-box-containing protein
MKVSLGEVDAMVVEISRASYYIEKAGILNLRVAGNAGLLYQLRFAVRSDWPVLCGILDKGLSSISVEERREIGRRWILVGEKSIFATRAFRISLSAGVGAIALAVIVVVGWNRTLRRTVRQRTSELQQELAERRHAEDSLAMSEARFRRLAENARDVIYRMSLPDGAYEYISPAVTELTGYAPEEFYRNPHLLREFIHPAWHGYLEEEWSRLLQGEMPPTYEFQIIHRSGDVRWVNQRNIMVRDENGRPVAMEGIVTDITERKRSEEELGKLNDELRMLNEELEQRVKQRTAELEKMNEELHTINRLFVGRELRMVELKERIRELENKSGESRDHGDRQ